MENDSPQKKKLKIISILALFVFLFDIYIVINFPKNYMLIIVSALLTLVLALLVLENWFEWKNQEKRELERQYIDIIKMERASHTTFQKKLQDLNDKINFIGQKIMPLEKSANINQKQIAAMLEAIMEGQKKVAKITINHNKENVNALINSNEQLLSQINEIWQSMNNGTISNQNSNFQQKESIILEKKAEDVLSNLQSLEKSTNSEKEAASLKEATNSEKKAVGLEEATNLEKEAASLKEATNSEKETVSLEESTDTEKETASLEESTNSEKKAADLEKETASLEDTKKAEKSLSDLEALEKIENETVISEEIKEAGKKEINLKESGEIENILSNLEISEETEKVEKEINTLEERKELDKESNNITSSDKKITPEDIAALISNTSSEKLPETTVKMEEEKKLPMPDMSDPSKIMSPEDIAALISNL